MCFSPQADLIGGIVIGAVGFDAARHVALRRSLLALALLPVLLALHQLDEAFVWWSLQGHLSATMGRVATWTYLLFAFVLLPVYVPSAVFAHERPGRRRTAIGVFIVLGTIVAAILFAAMVRGPVRAELRHLHLAYEIGLPAGGGIVAAYVAATCGSLLLCADRHVRVFGLLNLLAVAVLARLAIHGFASLWCAWAAVTSVAIAAHVRISGPVRPRI